MATLISESRFQQLVDMTSVGRSHPGADRDTRTLEAARLYMVEGFGSKSACAKKVGISRSSATTAINRLYSAMQDPDNDVLEVTYTVPRELVKDVDSAVERIMSGYHE